MRTLVLLGVITLVTALIPMWLLVKTMTFAMGLTYFALYPIAVNFPEYRLLVSPTKRLFWNIPTHGELRVANLLRSCANEEQRNGLFNMYRLRELASPRIQYQLHLA